MNDVKTYNHVNTRDGSLSFGISKMEDIYDNSKGILDKPHRHNYFSVLLTIEACGKHLIDFTEYTLTGNQIFFISPGQVHQVVEEGRSKGYSIVFSDQFLVQNNIQLCFIEDLKLFNDFGQSPPLLLKNIELEKLCRYAVEMYELNQSDTLFKLEAIGALLKLILIKCNNICTKPQFSNELLEKGNLILKNFKTLINAHYFDWHATTDYANELNVTANHLNRVVKSLTGKTAKEHIQSRIIIAAKRLIYFSDLSNKEIGYELGFSEPANFSAFFKKCTGVSPSKFKLSS